MCGILGLVQKNADQHLFTNALDRLTHRGPDGSGIWSDEFITLGHRRLSILDLSDQGKQPMLFGDLVITYNGEIYNFLEIKQELQNKGYKFYSESDTEVILAAFQEWQEDCLHKFNGMWAMAIWNRNSQELFLARDRFGKKPLFYAFIDDKFVFASEMKAIFPYLPEVKPAEDFAWCLKYFMDYEETDKCIIHGIKRFPAGSFAYLKLDQQQLAPLTYWNTLDHLQNIPAKYEEQVEQFRALFIDACKIRMRSDVSIGTALSGGLDSSATICTMAHIAQKDPSQRVSEDWQHAFVATFPNTILDESVYARKVADHLNIQATYLPIDPSRGIDSLYEYLYYFEELYITSPIPMMELYKSVRQNGVSVSIDGHGADELFSGYGQDIYKAFLDAGVNFKQIKQILKTFKGIRDIPHEQMQKEEYTLKQYKEYMVKTLQGRKNFLKYIVKDTLGLRSLEKPHLGKYGHLNTHLFQLFHRTILPTLLRNYDRYAMASGVEIRMPFMDHRLVSFCFSLPWQSKVRNGYTKAIVRDALQDFIPKDVVWRTSKIGFHTPFVDWMKGAWKEFLLDEINSTDFNNCTLIEPAEVRKIVEHVIFKPNVLFGEGEHAWKMLIPYFWEKALIKNQEQYTT